MLCPQNVLNYTHSFIILRQMATLQESTGCLQQHSEAFRIVSTEVCIRHLTCMAARMIADFISSLVSTLRMFRFFRSYSQCLQGSIQQPEGQRANVDMVTL